MTDTQQKNPAQQQPNKEKAAATPPAEKTEDKTPTAEELAKSFAELPAEFREAINKVNADIDAHNKDVAAVQSAEKKDPLLIKEEVWSQDTHKDKDVSRLYREYLKLVEQSEKIKDQAYALIDERGLMPKDLSPEEIEKLKAQVSESTSNLRKQQSAFAEMEKVMPLLAGKLTPHIKEIKTRRGTAKTSTSSTGEATKRIRFKRIEVNDQVEDDKGNKVSSEVNGETKYTFTFAANYLKKQHRGINWTPKDLTDAYLKGLDENNLPDVHTFVMPYTYKDANGNEHTVEYRIKCYR